MKRLFGVVIVFVVFLSFYDVSFGQVTTPSGLKPVTANDYNILKTYSDEIDNIYELAAKSQTGFWEVRLKASPSNKYVEILNQAYNNSKNNPETTRRSLEVEVLNSFIIYLNEVLNGTNNQVKAEGIHRYAIETVRVNVNQKFQNAISAVQLERGVATRQENTSAIVQNNETAKADALKIPPVEKTCLSFNEFSPAACVSAFFTAIIKGVLVNIAGFFLWLTSNLFSYVIGVGIVNFKQWAPDQLYPIWVLIRQILSLGIVFVGVYLGIMYIIGREDKFERYLPWVIMFALFVNFSYPITRFAVDVSNSVSLSIYSAAFGQEAFVNGPGNASPGAVIMNRLGLQSLLFAATEVGGSSGPDLLSNVNSPFVALLVVIFVSYAAYVFFMATALIAMRTVALVFIIVASPFLFIDSVLPFLGDKAKQLREIFFAQLTVAPVFMLMMALTLKFLDVFQTSGGLSGNVTSITTGGTANQIAVFFNVFMMIIMLHITIKISKSISGDIGNMATNALGKVGGFATGAALGAATGGAGLLARNSIGRLASKVRDSKWMERSQNNPIGRRLYDMSNSLAKSSFDLRNSSVVAGGASKLGLRGIGRGRTAGYEEAMEKRREEILARGARIKTRYERDVYEDEKDEKGNFVYEDIDITDKDGNVVGKKKVKKQKLLHRKGDIDVEGEKAQQRYIDSAGGTMFLPKEQQTLVREGLAKQAEEASDKAIKEAEEQAAKIVASHNKAEDYTDPRTGKVITKEQLQDQDLKDLRNELRNIEESGVNLQRDGRAQVLIRAINTIEEAREKTKSTEDKKIKNLLEQYNSILGKDQADKEDKQRVFLNRLDADTRKRLEAMRESESPSIILGADGKPIEKINKIDNRPTDIDLDLSEPAPQKEGNTDWSKYDSPAYARNAQTLSPKKSSEDIAFERKLRLDQAARRAAEEMQNNQRPDPTEAPIDDGPKGPTHDPRGESVADLAMQAAKATIRKAQSSSRHRTEIINAFAEAQNNPDEIARIIREAEKMGFDSDQINKMRDEAATI